jgi:TonB family protein
MRGYVWALAISAWASGCATVPGGLDCKLVVPSKQMSSVGLRPPEGFWKDHSDGTVTLEILIEIDGAVRRLHVLKSSGPEYTILAVDSVRKWRYDPAMCDGRAIPILMTVNIRFSRAEANS